jgi:hypothetical protein
MRTDRCVYCRQSLPPEEGQVRAQLHRRKVLGGGADRDGWFHPVCFAAFARQGGRLAGTTVVWEVLHVEVVPPHSRMAAHVKEGTVAR